MTIHQLHVKSADNKTVPDDYRDCRIVFDDSLAHPEFYTSEMLSRVKRIENSYPWLAKEVVRPSKYMKLSFRSSDDQQAVDVLLRTVKTDGEEHAEMFVTFYLHYKGRVYMRDYHSRDWFLKRTQLLNRFLFTAEKDYILFVDAVLGPVKQPLPPVTSPTLFPPQA